MHCRAVVSFVTASSLVNELMGARDEKRLLRLQRQFAKVKRLIIPSRDIAVQCPVGQWIDNDPRRFKLSL